MKGSELDFEAIHRLFEPQVRRYLARLAGEAEAEDLTQETFIKVSGALDRFRGESRLSTWIHQIATRTAIDSFRRKEKRPGSLQASTVLTGGDEERMAHDLWMEEVPSSDQKVIRGEMNACIREIVSTLPDAYRTVLVLSELDGLGSGEIADLLGISREAVKIRLHRGRAKLKEALSRQCTLYRDERNEFACDRKGDPMPPGKGKVR